MKYAPTRAAVAMGTFLSLLAISCAKEGLHTGGTGGATTETGGAVTSSGGAGGGALGGSGGSGGVGGGALGGSGGSGGAGGSALGGSGGTSDCRPVPPCPSGWYQYSDQVCGPPHNGTQACRSNGDGMCYPQCQTTADCTDPRFPTCGVITVFGGSDAGLQKPVCLPVAGLARCSGGTGGASGTGGVITGTGGTRTGRGGAGGHLGSGGSSGPTGGTTTTPDAGPQSCVGNGRTYAIGESFSIDCNTCTCTAFGVACTAMACIHDAAADQPPDPDGNGSCSLSANLTFGHDGGNAIYRDSNRLTAAGLTITRDYSLRAGRDGATTASCSPSLPACGTADAVTVATIDADLADVDVQTVWGLPQSPVPLFGTDPRPVDGTVYSIALDDGRKVLVGGQCASPAMSSCRSIPAGLLRLSQDLQQLAAAGLADPLCKGL